MSHAEHTENPQIKQTDADPLAIARARIRRCWIAACISGVVTAIFALMIHDTIPALASTALIFGLAYGVARKSACAPSSYLSFTLPRLGFDWALGTARSASI